MGSEGIAPIQVGAHAGDDAHAALAGGGDTLTEEVTAMEKPSVTVELDLRRIEGEDAGHTDENDVGAGRVPIICPFFNVHYGRIVLCHVALTDAANLLLPGQGGRIDWSQPRWQRNEGRSRSADG